MPLQISLLKEEDKEKEKERKQAAAAAGSSSSASTSTTGSVGSSIISSNLKSGSSGKKGSSSSSSSSSKDKTVEQPKQPETEELAPVVKPNQLKTRYKVPGAEQPQANVPTLEDRQAQIEKIRSQKWYSGDTPTEVEVLAQITRIAEVDYDEGLRLSDMYLAEKKKGTYNQTYSAPTSQYMTDLGIDPSMLTDETIAEFQAYINEYGVNTASGGVSTAKANGKEAKLAGQLSALLKDHADTKELLAEQDKALNEAAYWIAQGYTDDEIIKKLAIGNGGKYTKLNKLFEKSEFGEVVPTTQAIALGTDYGLLGALYEMRNPDKNSGDILLDAVNAQLGRGAQSKTTPAEIARRTPGDKSWAPYATGTTMHDDAILFGVTGFNREWLEKNRESVAASGDQEKISAYGRISDAVERTEKAQEESTQLIDMVERAINSGMSPDQIFTDDLLDDYPTLKQMDEGQKSLRLVDIAYPVDFDMYALRNEAEKAYNEYKGTLTSEDYTKELDASTGASSPVYEGDKELDKEEEKNSDLVRRTMWHTQTPAESSALKVFKPGSYRVMASAASAISAGGGGLTEAYQSAIGAANDYAGDHYLNAVSTLAGVQQQLDALEKPVADFVNKWFPGQDEAEVVAKLASGQMQYPDDAEFNSDYSLVTNQVGSFEDFQAEQSELKAQIINEQTILDNITAQFASAEELNTSGAESQSVMPMLNYIGQFSTYDAKQDYASFGDWQYDVELNGVSWDEASKLIGERKENNLKDLEYIDTAIQYAEDHGVDEAILTSMRRARDVIETDNQSIDYAQMRNKDGFGAAVEQFNSNEGLEWFAFDENSRLKNALIGFEDAMKDGLSEEAYLANPHIDKDITLKIALMTVNEKNTYKYLYENEGADAATEFFHFIDGTYLTNRASEYRQMRAEEETKKHPILMNAVSIVISPYQALGIVEVARSVLTGDEINPNSEWFAVGKTISQVRETSQNKIVNHFGEGTLGAKIGTFGYQVVTSIGDSLAASPVGGAVTMGLTSFANTAMEATEKGGDKWDVILYAGITGLAETATEYLPMGAIEDAFKAGGKQGVQGLLKSMANGITEAPGEMLSELISGLSDEVIMGDLSEYQQNVAAYISEGGMTPEEAEKKAREDFWKGVGMAGLQGLVAGSAQTTVGYAGGWALQSMQRNSDSKNAKKNGTDTQKQNTAPDSAKADTDTVNTQSAEQESAQPAAEAATAVNTDAALVEATETPVEPVATEAAEPTAEAAEAGAQQPTETAGQTTAETAAPTTEQPTRSGTIIRMVATLATCQKKGVSIADRAATVQAVLEAGGLKPDVALAMAKLVAGDGGKLQKLQKLVQKAGDTELGTALKAEAYRLLAPSAKTDGMSDADVVRTVESDAALNAEVNNAVMNSAIASETVNVLAGMDKTGVNNALNGMRDAKRDLSAARKRYNAQQNALENARQALQNANAQMRQNPGDSKLTNRTLQAAKELAVQQKLVDEAQVDVDAAKQRFDDAKAKAQEESSKLANEARGTAKQNVEQRMVEEAAAERKAAEQAQTVVEEPVSEVPAVEQNGADSKPATQSDVRDESTLTATPQGQPVSSAVSDRTAGNEANVIQRTQVPPQTVQTGNQQNTQNHVNPIQSTQKLATALGVGTDIGTRRMNNLPQDVLGFFHNRTRYIATRSRSASNITVAFHEIGHAISQRVNLQATPSMVANLDPAFAQNYEAAQLPNEAFAEFVWRYMTDDQQAEAFAGNTFIRQFEQELRQSGIADAVHTARDEMHAYVNASVNDRIGAMVVDRSNKRRSTVREWFTKALAGTTDATAPLEAIVSATNTQADAGNIRNAALMRNTASKRAWNILTQNSTDSNWTVNGDSLATVIERTGIRGRDFDLLNNYMLALHSLDRDTQGLPVFDESVTADQRNQFIADVQQNNREVADAAQAIHNWWHDFMQTFMVDTGFLGQEALDRFEQMYPHYVPTNRVKETGVRRSNSNGNTYTVRRATGSTEEIYNPMDSIVQNVNTIVNMVSQNNLALVWDNMYQQYDGLGIFGRDVTEDMRADRVNMENVRNRADDILTNATTDQDVIDRVLEVIGDEQVRWHGTGNVNDANILSVQRPDGNRVFYKIADNEIFKALAGLREPEVSSVLDYVGRFTRGMAALTTGSNPLFSFRNFMRDFQKSVTYGSWATNYGTGLVKWLRSAYDVWTEGGEYEQYRALGGGGWTRIEAGTRKGADEYRGALFRGYNTSNIGRTAKWAGREIWNTITLERINEVVEQASRYAEYKYGQQDKSTPEGRQKAFLNAQEATVDFNRSGNSHIATELKRIIPFFNASMQGVYQTGREFLSSSERSRLPERFTKTVVNTVLASALSSALLIKNMDDEDKEEFFWLSDDLKAEHFYIPNFLPEVFGEAPLLRIPLAQDPLERAVHGAVTNMIWKNEGDEPVIDAAVIAGNIVDGFNPISGTIFDAGLAMKTNTNWYGSNIVPTRMESWHPSTQYTEETPDFFVALGRATNVSPMMLQYMAEQYFGFVGQIVIPAISKDANTGEMQGISAIVDAARKKFTSDPLVSNDVVSAFYDSADMLEEISSAAKNNKPQYWLNHSLNKQEAKAAADEARAMGLTGGVVFETKKMITDAYNRIDEIEANATLTDKEKYKLTSEIRREMLENVLDANETIGAYKEKYVNGENMLTRMFQKGETASLSTTFEKLPETFRNAYEGGEEYMQRAHDVWEATGKDGALPKVNTTFSSNKVEYTVADEYLAEFTSRYQVRYQKAVDSIVGWDAMSSEQKLEALQSAHRKAQEAAKEWYVKLAK